MNNPSAVPSFKLICQKGAMSGQTFQGSGNMVTIGRELDCQIQINDSNISRHHARLSNTMGIWVIEDQGSSNGTFVNGQRVQQPVSLKAADVISLGGVTFLFQPEAGSSDQTRVGPPAGATSYNPQPVVMTPPVTQQPVYQAPPSYPPQQPYPAPAPVPQYMPPPPPMYAPPPKKGPGACLWIGLIGCGGLLCIVAIVVILILTNVIRIPNMPNIFNLFGGNTGGLVVNGNNNLTLNSAQSGVVNGPNGAAVVIPDGAVPPMENGGVGEMTFSIQESSTQAVSLPPDFRSYGPVYELGPEGFTFNVPVEIRLPIPDGVDPTGILGLTYLDSATGEWVMVPGTVDETNRTVSVMSTHFSPWSIFGPTDANVWLRAHGGWIQVDNNHTYNSGSYSGGRNLPTTVTYGVCIESYSFDNPADASAFSQPSDWTITVSDYRSPYNAFSRNSYKWWFPSGTFNLIEIRHVSEVNNSPLYVPEYTTYYRSIGSYRIENSDTLVFPDSAPSEDAVPWIEGRPPCFGIQDTSVGHGDVQITLTWEKGIDLDLHVVEPNGEEVYYGYTISSTNGQLDRDNRCSNMTIGRPENIFWPTGEAPSGTYTIYVNYFSSCEESGPVSYTVRTTIMGEVHTYTGTIESGTDEVTTFTIP